MNNPIVQLSNVRTKLIQFTALTSPIWRAKLWIDSYEKNLPFMSPEDTDYNRYSVTLNNVIIDFVEFEQINKTLPDAVARLRNAPKTWMLDPNDDSVLWIHFEFHNPPFSFLNYKTGEVIGFSYKKSVLFENQKLYPLLLDFPDIEDSADNFTYKKMVFPSGNIVIDNSSGMLDELIELFGNDITLLNYINKNTADIIRQFFISEYNIGLNQIKFSVKDKRSRLTFKAPNTFYTEEEFPNLERDKNNKKLVNKIIQDAYGYCKGVKGICVESAYLYEEEPNTNSQDPDGKWHDYFQFKFARTITEIEKVYVKKSDTWIEVFPGLGVFGNKIPTENEFDIYQKPNPRKIKIISWNDQGTEIQIEVTENNCKNLPKNDGRIAIYWSQALRDNPGHLDRRNGEPEDVKMDGVFVNLNSPGDIVKDLMVHYGELPYASSYFDLKDWEDEMGNEITIARPIGICLDKAEDIYNWIEKIQNGALLGFQLLIYKNLFSARLDNPNRFETFNIKFNEIINRDELEYELNGDNYATYTKINYLQDFTEEKYLTLIDKSKRLEILDVYKYEKEYANDTYLINEEEVLLKGEIILESFMNVQPVIKGIKLNGMHWDDIKLFSTGYIDFTVNLPRQMRIIQKYMKNRKSLERIRVKVINCKRNIKDETVTIDVIQCDRLLSLIVDITGEYPDTPEENYKYDLDGLYADTPEENYKYEFEGDVWDD